MPSSVSCPCSRIVTSAPLRLPHLIKFCTIVVLTWSQAPIADLYESVSDPKSTNNNAYEEIRIKHKALEQNQQDSCFYYVSIYGNKQWRKRRRQLLTTIEKTKCKKITILKIIKNVRVSLQQDNLREYEINIGQHITREARRRGIVIESKTIIENSKIRNRLLSSDVNTGTVIDTSGFLKDGIKVKSEAEVTNSRLGQK